MRHKVVTGEGFKDYYTHQVGGGMTVFSGAPIQRGHGLGNVLKGLFRVAMPLLKNVGKQVLRRSTPFLKKVGKQALKRGLHAAASEMSKSKRPRAARVVGQILQNVTTNNNRRKNTKRKRTVSKKIKPRKMIQEDIFSR